MADLILWDKTFCLLEVNKVTEILGVCEEEKVRKKTLILSHLPAAKSLEIWSLVIVNTSVHVEMIL